MSSTNSKKLRIKKLRLTNVAGISELEVDANGRVQLVGGNGAGKSTVVRAIESVVKGGHEITLLKNGAEEGEIYLLLEDETEVRKRITPGGSDLSVRNPDYGSVSAAKAWVERHLDVMSVNLIDVMLEERGAELLLEAIPMHVDLEQIREAIGGGVAVTDDIDADGLGTSCEFVDTDQHALQALAQIRGRIYQRRRDVGRDADKKKKSVQDLRDGMPEDLGSIQTADDVRAERQRLESEQADLKAGANRELKDVHEEAKGWLKALEEEAAANKAKIDEEIESLRERIRKLEARKQSIETETARSDAKIRKEYSEVKEAINAEYDPEINSLQSKIDACDLKLEQAAERAARVKHIREAETERDDLQGQYDELTSVLERLDDLKTELLSDLPIGNIELGEDGQIYHDDGDGLVPLSALNTEKRIRLAFEVLKLRGDKAAFVDGAERLETKNLLRLAEEAEAAGIQLWTMSVADDQPLTVVSHEDEAAAEVAS